jgi:hypothetical protein
MRRSAMSSTVGGTMRFSSRETICTTAMEELASVLQMVVDLVILGHKKGRVRFLWMVGAHASRGRG